MTCCICSPFLAGLEDTAAAQTVAGELPEDKFERGSFPQDLTLSLLSRLSFSRPCLILHISINLKKAGAGGERLQSWRQSKGGELSQVAVYNLYQFEND